MKVAYFGFDLFYDCLEQIKESGNEIIKIFTCKVDGVYEFSDRVFKFANDNGIEITDNKVTKKDIKQLKSDGCELLFSAGYYFKIPISDGVTGVNIHPAVLPHGKGPWPQPVTILKGLEKTGITLHKLSNEFDSGNIVMCEEFDVLPEDNLETLTRKYAYYAKRVTNTFFAEPYKYLDLAYSQVGGEYWHEPDISDMTFSLDDGFDKIDRITRAFYGFGCFLKFEEKSVKILRAKCLKTVDSEKNDYVDLFEIDGGWLAVLKYA